MSSKLTLILHLRLLPKVYFIMIWMASCVNMWKYCTAVGMLSYLQNTSRPEISMAVHQTARFSNNPMLSCSLMRNQ